MNYNNTPKHEAETLFLQMHENLHFILDKNLRVSKTLECSLLIIENLQSMYIALDEKIEVYNKITFTNKIIMSYIDFLNDIIYELNNFHIKFKSKVEDEDKGIFRI